MCVMYRCMTARSLLADCLTGWVVGVADAVDVAFRATGVPVSMNNVVLNYNIIIL